MSQEIRIQSFKEYCLEVGGKNRYEWQTIWYDQVVIRLGDLDSVWDSLGKRWVNYENVGPSCVSFRPSDVHKELEKAKLRVVDESKMEYLVW
jgi:hypothetical protein